ncbi:MAG TPA: type III polyketide synthase [Ohtaekwangia sp.]|nr:type III polyketide synthase [Ohtaekwangia sp.]
MSYITAIGTANPDHRFNQTTIADFMVQAMKLDGSNERKLRTLFKASGIDHRHSVIEDYGRKENFTFYPNGLASDHFPSTETRLRAFRENALPLSVRAVQVMLNQLPEFDVKKITHLVVVCCTGMYAPGLDIELVKSLKLAPTIERTCITFMGCYAAFNAFKVANACCKGSEDAKVLVVCTELCSLHFQHTYSEDNLLANTLFADGSAAVLVEARTEQKKRFAMKAFHSDLALEGENDMAWSIGDLGFEMKLTSYIPAIIKNGVSKLTDSLLSKIGKHIGDIRFFALHPGGVKILESIEKSLGITKSQNAPAYAVLKDYGNMSSPTVIFVLNELFKTMTSEHNDELILSLAFGPGLTLESMVLKIETT